MVCQAQPPDGLQPAAPPPCTQRAALPSHPQARLDDPSYQEPLANLQELGSINLWRDHNTIDAHSMQLAAKSGDCATVQSKRSKRTKAEPAAEPTKGKGKAAKAKPAPQPGRWLDRDCNAALNMQRIGESRWRPLELCFWPEQGKLPAKGKEYPGLGYKRLRDKPHTAQQQPAVAHLELKAYNLDKKHIDEVKAEADKHRRLLGMKQQGSL
ncbi:hypothetical protein QJQ45_010827 [Haematococcus lacustris]|nr:hypothetical protein QJQ45_010827 [Haematococcus lacustris]